MSLLKRILVSVTLATTLTVLGCINIFGATGMINSSSVNVRSDKSTTSNVIEKLDEGYMVEVVSSDNGWYEVKYGEVEQAYIFGDFLDITESEAFVIEDRVNLRAEASDKADVLDKLYKDDKIIITGKTSSNWFRTTYEGNTAYIFGDFIDGEFFKDIVEIKSESESDERFIGIVSSSTGLNLRDAAELDAKVINILRAGTTVDVVEDIGEWARVSTKFGEGYVSTEFLTIKEGISPTSYDGDKGEAIVEYAKQFIGTPYVWSGTNLDSGVDCSGFVYSVFDDFNIDLCRSSASMENADGYYIDKSELRAGDLIFFDTTGVNDGGISHVGIYMGNGQYIHSSSGASWGVTITDLNSDYSVRTYVSSKRVL